MATDFPPLVTASALYALLQEDGCRVLDASWYLPDAKRNPKAEFLKEHIPGARFFDLDQCSDSDTDLPHMLPTPEVFSRYVGKLGISEGDVVVVYDTAGLFSAARAWWMFRMFGHTRVAVLDGGFPLWRREGLSVESGGEKPFPKTYRCQYQPALLRTLDDMRHNLFSGRERVLDARSPGRFYGEEKEPRTGVRSGHIPGSRNLHYATLLTKDGKLKSATELRKLFKAVEVEHDTPVIASCGSGVTACIIALAMEAAGYPQTAVYDGSWAEWGRKTQNGQSTPVATGRRETITKNG